MFKITAARSLAATKYLLSTLLWVSGGGCQAPLPLATPNAILDPSKPFTILEPSNSFYHSVGQISSEHGKATGFIIAPHLVLTNFHATEECTLTQCTLVYNQRYPLSLIARRLYPDLALLAIDSPDEAFTFNPLPLALDSFAGEAITIIQDLSRRENPPQLSTSLGTIAEKNERPYWSEIEYGLNTQEGSSGSPLVNSQGEVVGVHKEFNEKTGRNVATTSPSIQRLLSRDLALEAKFLVAAFDITAASSAKYDLAQIFLEARQGSTTQLNDVNLALCQAQGARKLLFYFNKIRKLALTC